MIDILVKGAAKERVILETIRAYEQLYPTKFEFYRTELAKLRQVTIASHTDLKGREVTMNMRVPTEPFLFLQAVLPGFGQDSDDITLLIKLWGDFANAVPNHERRKRRNGFQRIYPDCPADPAAHDPRLSGHDRQELRGAPEGLPG